MMRPSRAICVTGVAATIVFVETSLAHNPVTPRRFQVTADPGDVLPPLAPVVRDVVLRRALPWDDKARDRTAALSIAFDVADPDTQSAKIGLVVHLEKGRTPSDTVELETPLRPEKPGILVLRWEDSWDRALEPVDMVLSVSAIDAGGHEGPRSIPFAVRSRCNRTIVVGAGIGLSIALACGAALALVVRRRWRAASFRQTTSR